MTEKNKALEQRTKIIKGLELTYQRLIEFKKRKGSPLIVSKNGKTIELSAEKAPSTTMYKLH